MVIGFGSFFHHHHNVTSPMSLTNERKKDIIMLVNYVTHGRATLSRENSPEILTKKNSCSSQPSLEFQRLIKTKQMKNKNSYDACNSFVQKLMLDLAC